MSRCDTGDGVQADGTPRAERAAQRNGDEVGLGKTSEDEVERKISRVKDTCPKFSFLQGSSYHVLVIRGFSLRFRDDVLVFFQMNSLIHTPTSRRVVVSGASGLVGSALVAALRARHCDVLRLVRRAVNASDEIFWDPSRGELDPAALENCAAIVNLAGENIGAGRWTAARREQILRSRVDATRTLVATIAKLQWRPRVFVNASAVGCYGNRGDEKLTEASAIGQGFLPEVCLAWETHAEGASRLGVRTVLTRFGMVLSAKGGALAKMLPVFRLGLGGRFGPGRQWMSWISRDDAIGAIVHAIEREECRGPINVVAPQPVTNAEFMRTLGRVLHRPAWAPVPAFILRAAFGQMADETLLASTRALPEKLSASGYVFRHADLESAMRAALGDH